MKDEYIIINKTTIQKRIEELRQVCNKELGYASDKIYFELEHLLSQSTSLESVVSQAYEAGKLDKELSLTFDNPKGRFMSNLNLDK